MFYSFEVNTIDWLPICVSLLVDRGDLNTRVLSIEH